MNCVYIAQSLDGFIAGPQGELDWLEKINNPDDNDLGFSAFMNSIDALVMGRNTYEKVRSFGEWPYDKPVFVISNQLTKVPTELSGKITFMSGSPDTLVKHLHQQGFQNLYIDGGKLIQSFLAAGLIDELTITTVPVLLGQGIPLFDQLPQAIELKLKRSEVLLNQLVKTTYAVT
ncbi:dihydrofolate reductase family protein [Litoribrevibacter albus]|uniref:Diacylglycerol kinase n=1 Tax=Litoribrevibacter albus TaxID=1473156 RepID=A0AA37S7X1_9GAMM|nr:dihydrofolate reductase family protein [Litoribrevibacter albus]GLQ29583.1 diacylglycerol kinase [Litoribrevibacter albus]